MWVNCFNYNAQCKNVCDCCQPIYVCWKIRVKNPSKTKRMQCSYCIQKPNLSGTWTRNDIIQLQVLCSWKPQIFLLVGKHTLHYNNFACKLSLNRILQVIVSLCCPSHFAVIVCVYLFFGTTVINPLANNFIGRKIHFIETPQTIKKSCKLHRKA